MTDTPSIQIQEGNAAFTNNLYQILATKPGNVFFSPLSVHAVISMAYQGAKEETSRVITQVLQIPDPTSTALGYKQILDQLKNNEDFVLYMANKIYVRQGEEFLKEFENTVREYYESEVEIVDFEKKVEAVKKINDWVALKTQEKIKSIVEEKSIEEDTAMFLLNAIYFKADWNERFTESNTKVAPFYLDNDNTVDVQMMNGRKNALYCVNQDLDAEILSLPYIRQKVSMVIILPRARNGLHDLELKLDSWDLSHIANGVNDARVDVSLPKFGFKTTINLEDALKQLGLGLMFDKDKANFRGMLKLDPKENVCVDKILQMAYIDVDEKGSEAAAVTVVRMRKIKRRGMKEVTIKFVVDHPAIFMLRTEEGNILFYGRLSHPKT